MEHLDVLIIGAGLSGIGAGHYIQTGCPWASYGIFEARDAIGGTWDLFRYPGIRSDSDMFTLGYSFRPWDGEKSIADGDSILRYINDTASQSGIVDRVRFNHKVVRADWDSADALWHVTAQRTDSNETFEMTAGFVFSCTGYYSYEHGYQPDFPGMDTFAGTIVHPQAWPEDLDYVDKNVIVIGSGATAITLVPSLAATADHVTMLQRSPTYIVSIPAKDPVANLIRKVLPAKIADNLVRWMLALGTQFFYEFSRRYPRLSKRILRKGVQRELPDGYDIDTHFNPHYKPWDQRVCVVPDGDLFKAIGNGSASVVTDRIDTFTKTGLRLESGAELDADIVITATGLDLLFLGGVTLSVDGDDVKIADKITYKGMMLSDVPNLAVAVGYTNASWTLKCDLTCGYVVRLLTRMHESGMRQCTPHNSDASITGEPLLSLTSGYVQRSADRFPKQGSKFPWQVHNSYLHDYRAMKLRGIDDDAMTFTNPRPSATRNVAPARS